MTTSSSAVSVPIQGTFDIAQARNTLRLMITQKNWATVFVARAATALTALGELILALNPPQAILIKMETVAERRHEGIQLSSQFRVPHTWPASWDERVSNLKRVAADTAIQESEDWIQITTYIWVN